MFTQAKNRGSGRNSRLCRLFLKSAENIAQAIRAKLSMEEKNNYSNGWLHTKIGKIDKKNSIL